MSLGDNLYECQNLFSWKNKKNISVCHLLKFLPSILSVSRKVSSDFIKFRPEKISYSFINQKKKKKKKWSG